MSRIVFWTPNYEPEPIGIAPLATDACEWLAARGHEVEVVTAFPNYPERRIHSGYGGLWRHERHDGVFVRRTWLRVRPGEGFSDKALYEASFAACSLPLAARRLRRTDVLVCIVPTLLSSAAGAALARLVPRGPRFVLWLQDLVIAGAEALEGLGPVARLTLRGAAALERATARAAHRVVVCSPGFRDALVEGGLPPAKVETIFNWVDTNWIAAEPPPPADGPARFLYSGNLGYSQGFETLVEAARLLEGAVEVEIVGAGNAAAEVRRLAAGAAKVSVRPPVPRQQLPALLASADALVVIQRSVSAGANLPSKIGPYLASGRPIIASLDSTTPAADLLRRSGGAVLVPPEDPAALAEAIRRLAADRSSRTELGRAGRTFAETELEREVLLPRLERALLGGKPATI